MNTRPTQHPDAIRILQQAGLRVTRPRTAVIAALLDSADPMTRKALTQKLGPTSPDKVTIYRTLKTLVEKDIVHKAFLKKRTWYFELAHRCTEFQCHPHFTCTQCNRTRCLTQVKLPIARDLPEGFVLLHQAVQLEGICSACSQRRAG